VTAKRQRIVARLTGKSREGHRLRDGGKSRSVMALA
jgi:hypothetical protein